jgi:hypothetical protein
MGACWSVFSKYATTIISAVYAGKSMELCPFLHFQNELEGGHRLLEIEKQQTNKLYSQPQMPVKWRKILFDRTFHHNDANFPNSAID